MNKTKLSLIIVFAVYIIGGCEVATPQANLTPHIDVTVKGTEPSEIDVEIVSQPNCSGSAEVENSIQKSREIAHVMEVQGGISLNSNGQVGFAGTDIELGATVASHLGYSYGTVESISRSITVKAKPGTNMQHTIRLLEVWKIGTAEVSVGDQKTIIPFRFRSEFKLELVDSKDMGGCDTSSSSTNEVSPKPNPTSTLAPEPEPTISLDTSAGSKLSEGQYWRKNGIALILEHVSLNPDKSCVGFSFDLENNSDKDIILTIVLDQFSVTDNNGKSWAPRALSHYVYCGDPSSPSSDSQITTTVEAGGGYWDAAYGTWIVSFNGPITDPGVTSLTITVNGLSQFSDAQWVIPIGH